MKRLSIHWNCKSCKRWIRPGVEHDCRRGTEVTTPPDRPMRTADRILGLGLERCSCVVTNRREGEEQREWFKRWMCMHHWMQTDFYRNKSNAS